MWIGMRVPIPAHGSGDWTCCVSKPKIIAYFIDATRLIVFDGHLEWLARKAYIRNQMVVALTYLLPGLVAPERRGLKRKGLASGASKSQIGFAASRVTAIDRPRLEQSVRGTIISWFIRSLSDQFHASNPLAPTRASTCEAIRTQSYVLHLPS
jgi:hypothetical protein